MIVSYRATHQFGLIMEWHMLKQESIEVVVPMSLLLHPRMDPDDGFPWP
jgi:aromatic ring-cleaving dioxygenase